MIYGIGTVQEEYLGLISGMEKVIKQIETAAIDHDINIFINQIDVLSAYGRQLIYVLPLFGYEQYLDTLQDIIDVFSRIKENGNLTLNWEIYKHALEKLIALTEKLLTKKEGETKKCNCCGEKVYYKRLPSYYNSMANKYDAENHIDETLNEEEYLCPSCMASDRDRLTVAFLERIGLDKSGGAEKLLQVAPSTAIEHWIFANCPSVIYHSTDLYMENVTFKSDVQNMSVIEDEFYDYFICSHVLEHVEDDRKAMKELCRILKKDGIGLFLVPVALDIECIDEEWGLSEEENWRRFGQGDHCRIYARQEMIDRLEGAGFTVYPLGRDFFGEEVFRECGLKDSSTLYVLTKQKKGIDELLSERRKRLKEVYEEPLVSVVMPTYNHEEYVAEAIESVLNQSYQNFEFLVADDGSTDGTVNEILKYEERIDEIHLFDVNTGCVMEGYPQKSAKGKYVAMMHSDDVWEPDKLKLQVIYMETHPECTACFSGAYLLVEGEKRPGKEFLMKNKKKEEWFRYFYENGNCLCHPSILIHREVYEELLNNSGSEMFRQLPDFWMWLKLIQKSEIHIIEKPLVSLRVHDKNTSGKTLENIQRHYVEEAIIWYDMIKKMDAPYFIKTFGDVFRKKKVTREEEIMCEKLFVLLNTRNKFYIQAAIYYLFEIYQLDGIPELLEEQYNFTVKDIFKITGEYIPQAMEAIGGKRNER